MPLDTRRLKILSLVLLLPGWLSQPARARAEENTEARSAPLVVDVAGRLAAPTPISATATAVVRFEELARLEAHGMAGAPPLRPWRPPEYPSPAEPSAPPAPSGPIPMAPLLPFVSSPGPSLSYMGLDDIPMVDSLYIVIPPDIGGAVGPTRVMTAFNNNYRIQDKATGAVISTVGTATFWASVVAVSERASLTDPRTLYDPYNDCWIAVMQTVTTGAGKLLLGVSQTSDPGGAWYLYNFNTAVTIDFPNVGFNKNWISIAVNRYSIGGTFQRGINLVVDYPLARTGTGTGSLFTHSANTHFVSSPCATYSPTSDTLYVVTHLTSSGATYALDTITGTPSTPVHTSGGSLTRPGGGWVQPGGNLLPQSAPVSGASACGATPCPIESQDAQIRSYPVYRGGFIYYTQTVGLPSTGLTHTGVQWTKIAAPGGAFADGGRIEDATATSTNGGKWYAYPHVAVNSVGDLLVGYTEFSSAQHPSAGYSVHMAGDGPGTIRDPLIFHPGEDYYHKTFSTTTGRNRWGDFSTAQVDPSDDRTLWTVQEYAKARTGTNDGNTGSNSSRWSSWWARVTTAYTITATAGPGGTIGPSGAVVVPAGSDTTFTITPDACHSIEDVLVDGISVGAVAAHTFTNVTADHTIAASFAPTSYTITAAAGPNGAISPTGAVSVDCGSDQSFTIAPDPGYAIQDVLVDAVSIGPVAGHTFSNVQADHTIDATFVDDTPPSCAVVSPNGGDTLFVAATDTLEWTATDNDSVTCVDLLLSRNGLAGPYDTLAACVANSGSYAWTATGPETEQAILKIVVHDLAGNLCDDASDAEFRIRTELVGIFDPGSLPITRLALATIAPNPTRGPIHVSFALPTAGRVRIVIYDVLGREVAVVSDREYAAGRHDLDWNGRTHAGRVAGGIYFVSCQAGGERRVQRVALVR